jgi:protein involved in polysaccharide export with SLBB domain
MARFPRPRFSLKSIMLLSLGLALGYAWNLWVWRLYALPGTEANMVALPTYVIEPPDVLGIAVTSGAAPTEAAVLSGQRLVAMDGRVNLDKFGSVYVAGLTMDEAAAAIKKYLIGQIEQPKVVVDVLAYNSKVYYVISEGRGLGDHVERLPITGSETVLDAVAALGSIPKPETVEIVLTRPAPNGVGPDKVIPIDWNAIANEGVASANYQLFPGDRLRIAPKNPPAKPATAAAARPTPDPAVQPASAEAPGSDAPAYSPSNPYRLDPAVQYYQPEPAPAPPETPLPNYFLYVKPQLDQRRTAANQAEGAAKERPPQATSKSD